MDKIGKQLKAYRLEQDLSVDEVALMLDIPVEIYATMETDEAETSLKQLLKLCRYYGIKPDDFLKPEVVESKPLAEPEKETLQETAVVEEEEEDFDTDYPSKYDLDRSKRKVTTKQAVEILKKHGTEITEDQAEKVLDFMYKMAPIALSQATREVKRQQRLERHPNGFPVKSGRFSCRLCGHGGGEHPMWYDRFGLKCRACQNAVEKGIVPGEIVGDDTLYYTEFNLGRYFGLKGKVLREWIKRGLLKPRTIPGVDGKGKHYQVFLTSDHEGFLPPITIFRIGGWVEDEEDGKKFYRTSEWYEYVEPFEYLKDYEIINYMKLKEPDKNENIDHSK